MVKGSNKPITLYTYDISLSAIADPSELEYQEDNMESLSHSFLSFKSEFEENPDITESIGSSQAFRDKFATGFQVRPGMTVRLRLVSAPPSRRYPDPRQADAPWGSPVAAGVCGRQVGRGQKHSGVLPQPRRPHRCEHN